MLSRIRGGSARSIWLLLAVVAAADLAVLSRVWWMSSRGLDLTDEGMYLNWMKSPWDWPWASTQFAFFYHPLWEFTGYDLVQLRRWAIVLLLACGLILYSVVIRRALFWSRGYSLMWGAALAPTVLLAVGSQSVFFTPSYNMLGMKGLMLAGAAVVGILVTQPRREQVWFRHWPWVMLGVAGVVCFASRPTAGALLLLVVLVALLIARAWNWLGLLLSAATASAGVVLIALFIDGSVSKFLQRVLEGLNLYSIQTRRSAADALVNTFAYEVRWQPADIVYSCLLALAVVAAVFTARRFGTVGSRIAFIFAAAMSALAFLASATGETPFTGNVERSGTVGVILTLAAALSSLGKASPGARGRWVTVLALMVLPFAYAFGTHYSTVALAGSATFCWIAASVVLLGPFDGGGARLVVVVASIWLLATVLCLNAAAGAAHRQEPLFAQNVPLDLAGSGDVAVYGDMASYLDSMAKEARGAGLQPQDPVLDLTGESPGLVYHLQASATADPWVIGRYPGSADRLSRQLQLHTSCQDIGRSWLLVSTDGARHIDPQVLGDVQIRFPGDYARVASGKAPDRSGGYEVQIWRPTDADALTQRCLSLR